MIRFHSPDQRGVELSEPQLCAELARNAVWIDVCSPTAEQESALEAAIGLDIPTRQELAEIELSSRLFKENNALFLTATVLNRADTSAPESSAVTFILFGDRLITLRYVDPKPFQTFRARHDLAPRNYRNGYDIFVGIVDAIVERIADILEGVAANLDRVSRDVFDAQPAAASAAPNDVLSFARKPRQRDFVEILRRIGRMSDLVSRARESMVSFARLLAFFHEAEKENPAAKEAMTHLATVSHDFDSLGDHASFISSKISFLLDATLGLINNEQNAIIKIISVAAVIFLPPTLVAGIYGMNFEVIPELRWAYGYPFAITMMIVSAVLPYWFFKRKGWL